MRLKKLISLDRCYDEAAEEIKAWVENSYPGLSIVFDWPTPEIVQVDGSVTFDCERVAKITEAVNIEIGEVLERRAEKIYIADMLDRIWARHPDFDPDIDSIEELKRNERFLGYIKELSAGRPIRS